MIPSKSGNNSRRSSILKPPKPRHPLQNLNFNNSSNENSPVTTTKIKRRVSFAEKKHVKEFCNSLEQGTVWDNTYEEHDISDVKISCSFQKEYESKSIHKENIFNNIHENNVQYICNETITKDINIERSNSYIINTIEKENCRDEMLLNESLIIFHNVDTEKNESIFSHDSQLKNNNCTSKNIIVYEDSDKKLIEQSNQISDYLESNVCNFDNNKLNITSDQNICMDLTEVVSPVANSINRDETKKMLKNASIELINDILPNKENFQQFNKSNVEEFSITNQNKSMEITVSQPSVIKLNKNIDNINTFCIDDKTKRLDISMEITSAIPTSLCNLQSNNNDINYYVSNLISYNNDNKITPFHDISMNTTKAIETIIHKSSDRSPVVQKISQYNITKQDEETKLLNTSMEITKIVPINIHSVIKNYGPNEINFDTETNVKKLKYDSDIYETLTNYDKTKFYNNEEMEFTTAITSLPTICQNNLQLSMQDISCTQLNSSNSISNNSGNHSLTNKTIIFDNNSMTVTKIVPTLDKKNQDIITKLSQSEIDFDICSSKFRQSILPDNFEKKNLIDISNNKDNLLRDKSTIVKISSLLNSDIISNDNRKMKCTKAVTSISTVDQNNLQIPQDILCTQSNSANPISDNCKNHLLLNKTIIFDDNSMIVTKIIPILDRKHQDTFFQTETDNTCSIKDRQSILSSNIKKRDLMNILSKDNIRDNIVTIPSSSNSDITSNNNEKMELTTAIISSSALHQNNLQIPNTIQNISCTQPNFSNLISDNCKNHSLLKTNKTIIFDDNSMIITKVVPILNKKQQDIIITDSQEINSDIYSAKVRQSILHNSIEKSNFTNFSVNIDSDVLKNNSKHVNSCLLSTNIENNVIQSSTPIKVQDFVNIKPSMSSHESMQQQTFASALKENNTEIVCANVTNCVSSKSFSAINLELNKNEHINTTQTAISHPRRTYTIHSNSNHTFTVNSKKENNISEINNDVSYELNNEKNNACSILNNTKDLENKEDYDIKYLMNGKDIFLNESLEILESIKPPSFDCLDDLSHIDYSTDIICNKKIDIETNCVSQNESEFENILKFKDYQKNEQIENEHKSQTFVIKRTFLNDALENSNENKIQTNEISKLELLTQENTDIDTDNRILEFSSSTINNSENFSLMHNTDEDFQKLHMDNSNLECLLSNAKAIYKTLKADDSNKLNDTHMMKVNNKFYSNEQFQSNLKSHTFCIEEENVIMKSFSSLMNELKICAKSNEIIWEVYYENIERNMFIIGFISCSLLVIIFIQNPCEETNDQYIKKINIISQLEDDADALITIVHRIILEKLDIKNLLDLYKNREDILPMLEYISKEVKLAMDFMFDLKRLNDPNLMEITHDSISFISQTKTGNIILKITINIKPFDKIEFQNISVHCLIGSVREEDVKKLIINVKKDHKFLRRYINDVKDYIYLME
ncbi:MATH and LRR domain-containing protein PFE0570w-like, partial [Apis laboriosa]|uniref:MATH and LRR domain-containing protein PFE0570w-like n=1 Tax=Apis laboriosa TaxID=183418 RepID=UPI001CC81B81